MNQKTDMSSNEVSQIMNEMKKAVNIKDQEELAKDALQKKVGSTKSKVMIGDCTFFTLGSKERTKDSY